MEIGAVEAMRLVRGMIAHGEAGRIGIEPVAQVDADGVARNHLDHRRDERVLRIGIGADIAAQMHLVEMLRLAGRVANAAVEILDGQVENLVAALRGLRGLRLDTRRRSHGRGEQGRGGSARGLSSGGLLTSSSGTSCPLAGMETANATPKPMVPAISRTRETLANCDMMSPPCPGRSGRPCSCCGSPKEACRGELRPERRYRARN